MNYDKLWRGLTKMPNGHAGPWRRISKMSPMKTALYENQNGQQDIVPCRLMWRDKRFDMKLDSYLAGAAGRE